MIKESRGKNDFSFFEVELGGEIDKIIDAYYKLLPEILKSKGNETIQILSPMHFRGHGIRKLNLLIQRKETGDTKPVFTKEDKGGILNFYVRDKVIMRKNKSDFWKA